MKMLQKLCHVLCSHKQLDLPGLYSDGCALASCFLVKIQSLMNMSELKLFTWTHTTVSLFLALISAQRASLSGLKYVGRYFQSILYIILMVKIKR